MALIYLILQIVFSCAFTLVIKWSQNRSREDIITIGAVNYIAAALLILPEFLQSDIEVAAPLAMWIGGSMGVCYFIAYFFVIYTIRHVGATSTTVVSVLSITVPMACAAVFWDEVPNGYQLAGIGLALIAMLMVGGRSKGQTVDRPWLTPVILMTFFALCGVSRLAQESFKHVCETDQRPTFLLAAFVAAAVPSVLLLLFRKQKIQHAELIFGVGLGTANILQLYFIIKSLQYLPGFIVFPFTSAGAVGLTTIVATQLLGERLNRRTRIGTTIAVFALFLLRFWA